MAEYEDSELRPADEEDEEGDAHKGAASRPVYFPHLNSTRSTRVTQTRNGHLHSAQEPKIFGLERRIRPQLFQSKWIGFAAPLAPGRIFTGGSWLKWREVPESSVLLTPPYVQSVRGSARAQTTEIAKFGYFSSTSLESSAAARFDL